MKQTKGFKKTRPKSLQHFQKPEVVETQTNTSGRFRLGCYTTPPGYSGFKRVVRQYKIGAGQRGIEFCLTDEQVRSLTSSLCHYCGIAPSKAAYCSKQRTEAAFERSKYLYNGIDRVDTTKGYEISNCVPCCLTCNKAKGTLTLKEFEDYMNRLVQFRSKIA